MSIRLTSGVRFLVLGIICTFLLTGLSAAQEKKPLPGKITRQLIQQIIPAIKAKDEIAFLNASMPLIKSLNPDRMDAVDELCQQHGVQTVREWFTDLVISKSEQGIDPARATSNAKMANLIFEGILERLNAFEERAANHVIMQDPLEVPAGFKESEELFWNVHVLHNEFEGVSRKIQFGRTLLEQHQKRLRRENKGEQLAAALTETETRLKQQYKSIDERAAELRLKRFEAAHKALTDPASSNDFELMLTSSMVLEQDGSVLDSFLKNNPSISRESLQAPELAARIKSMMASGQAAAGDVAEKANLFRNGLHYWVRGRYGSGPAVNGLVKSPGSTGSLEAMETLYMPRVRNKPIRGFSLDNSSDTAIAKTYTAGGDSKSDSSESDSSGSDFLEDSTESESAQNDSIESTPGVDRRHYYTWAAEYRPARVLPGSRSTTSSRKFGPAVESIESRFL